LDKWTNTTNWRGYIVIIWTLGQAGKVVHEYIGSIKNAWWGFSCLRGDVLGTSKILDSCIERTNWIYLVGLSDLFRWNQKNIGPLAKWIWWYIKYWYRYSIIGSLIYRYCYYYNELLTLRHRLFLWHLLYITRTWNALPNYHVDFMWYAHHLLRLMSFL